MKPATAGEGYLHIVGDWEHWLDRLRLKVPRALCGELLLAEPDDAPLPPHAPQCPACVVLNGGSPGGEFVESRPVRWPPSHDCTAGS